MKYEIPDDIKNSLFKFLSKAVITGAEAPEFMSCVQALNMPIPEPEPKKREKDAS